MMVFKVVFALIVYLALIVYDEFDPISRYELYDAADKTKEEI